MYVCVSGFLGFSVSGPTGLTGKYSALEAFINHCINILKGAWAGRGYH